MVFAVIPYVLQQPHFRADAQPVSRADLRRKRLSRLTSGVRRQELRMQSAIIELKVSPPFERPHLQGVLAKLSIVSDSSSIKAEIQARPYQAMGWMEFEPGAEFKGIKPHLVSSDCAQAVLDNVLKIRVPLMSSSLPGIHETSFRLRAFSGASFCEFSWWHEVPAEWQPLEDVVREIQAMANEVLSAA